MSTKIYDAYRIKKSEFPDKFIADILKKFKDKVRNKLLGDRDILEGIHILTAIWIKNEKGDEAFKKFIEKPQDEQLGPREHIFDIKDYLVECERQATKSYHYFDIDFNCSVFEDDDYWYLKFYANQRWQWDLLSEWEDEFDWLEDYHYQNQTDPPKGFTWEEFQKRDHKWDELTGDEDNYKNGLQYTFMDSHDFYMLVSRSTWDDTVNLAYNFNGLTLKDIEDES